MHSTYAKLQIGCFDQIAPGWINTDVTLHIHIARVPRLAWLLNHLNLIPEARYRQHAQGLFRHVHYLDVTKRFRYGDDSFDFVYSSHLLEHLYPDQAIFCLSEVYRILKRGGIVRIAAPDLDQLVRSYDPANPDLFLDGIFETRQRQDKNRHHWHYNHVSLRGLLVRVGFEQVQQCEFRQGRCADVASIDTRPESLFVEATK